MKKWEIDTNLICFFKIQWNTEHYYSITTVIMILTWGSHNIYIWSTKWGEELKKNEIEMKIY